MNIETILGSSRAELRTRLGEGYPVDDRALNGHVYEGVSLGLPRWVERLSWKKFQKAFYSDEDRGVLRGWNIRTIDDGLDQPWVDQTSGDTPRVFGHFNVVPPDTDETPPTCRQGLLLDYGRGGAGGNGLLNRLRDPIVSLRPDGSSLLLGWSYLSLAGCAVGTPSYFLLRRGRPIDYVPAAPV